MKGILSKQVGRPRAVTTSNVDDCIESDVHEVSDIPARHINIDVRRISEGATRTGGLKMENPDTSSPLRRGHSRGLAKASRSNYGGFPNDFIRDEIQVLPRTVLAHVDPKCKEIHEALNLNDRISPAKKGTNPRSMFNRVKSTASNVTRRQNLNPMQDD